MTKVLELTGQRFGRLIVIKRNFPNSKHGTVMWLCKCDCGKEKIIKASQLRQGKTQSCGCLHLERIRLNYGLAEMNRKIYNYKKHAKERGLRYELDEKQFKEITQKNCFYCGVKPNNGVNSKRKKKTFGYYIYNGIDRTDNNKGYTIDNVVPCCKICNQAKSNLTLSEFKDWLERAYNKIFLKEIKNEKFEIKII